MHLLISNPPIMKTLILASLILATQATQASTVTFVIGDGFELDGSDSFNTDPRDGDARDSGVNDAGISSVFDVATNAFQDPFGGDDGFDPISVGDIFFSNGIHRGGLDFNLGSLGLPAFGPGESLQVTNIELFLEVSGATFTTGLNADDDDTGDNNNQNFSVTVDVFANADIQAAAGELGISDASFSIDTSQTALTTQFFAPISLANPASLLDLNTLTTSSRFEIVLATPNETDPNGGAVFGSGDAEGASPNGVNFGTDSIAVAPVLRITAIVVPEPTTFTLAGCAGLAFLLRRKR